MEREPCPYRIVDDAGGAFAMGTIGGSMFSAIKGFRNAPQGKKLSGGLKSVKARAPVYGGNFAAWGTIFSTCDCTLSGIRRKEDMLNPILSGGITGAVLAVRSGRGAMARNFVVGAVLLSVIEGVSLFIQHMAARNMKPVQPQLQLGAPP
ncbi:probable mitochondrial import inner membrane translocase subunit Tim17 1 [Sycon ciliatum]|uniref:probable mitochondrial import inner membrane translocase subunit Tim17 1 n=1 Tax=Sycon ciliatum TaxID=27933 RepID=UPI0031F6D162